MRISDWSSDVCSSDLSNAFNGFSGPEPYIVLAPIDQVFQFDLHISAPLARLSVLNFHGAPTAAFIFNLVARTNVHATDLHRASRLFKDVTEPRPAPLIAIGLLRTPARTSECLIRRSAEHTSELQSLMRISSAA